MKKTHKQFIFDLDGTLTSQETLPLIAKHFGIEAQIDIITQQTIAGNIPFVESFIKRVHILGALPVSKVDALLSCAPLYAQLWQFIKTHSERCAVATGNLSCWVEGLMQKLGCKAFCSQAMVKDDKVEQITSILRKETIVEQYQNMGCQVIYIGDGNNDMEAMRCADIAIAVGMTHEPSRSLLPIADYLIFNEKTLCRQLNQLL
jgi:HAD superfamily phosphoserine phosphatase-like hydrolase